MAPCDDDNDWKAGAACQLYQQLRQAPALFRIPNVRQIVHHCQLLLNLQPNNLCKLLRYFLQCILCACAGSINW